MLRERPKKHRKYWVTVLPNLPSVSLNSACNAAIVLGAGFGTTLKAWAEVAARARTRAEIFILFDYSWKGYLAIEWRKNEWQPPEYARSSESERYHYCLAICFDQSSLLRDWCTTVFHWPSRTEADGFWSSPKFEKFKSCPSILFYSYEDEDS